LHCPNNAFADDFAAASEETEEEKQKKIDKEKGKQEYFAAIMEEGLSNHRVFTYLPICLLTYLHPCVSVILFC